MIENFILITLGVLLGSVCLGAAALILTAVPVILGELIEDAVLKHRLNKLKVQDEKQRLDLERETLEKSTQFWERKMEK